MRSRWSEELLAWSEGEWRVDAWDIVIIARESVKQASVMQPIAKGHRHRAWSCTVRRKAEFFS
jgi:hypothetical protein